MRLTILKEGLRQFPRQPSSAERRLICRYVGAAVWAGVFLSLTLLAVMCSRFSGVPGLAYRLCLSVGSVALAEIILGYLLWTGTLIRD